jgi:hypothetical protein
METVIPVGGVALSYLKCRQVEPPPASVNRCNLSYALQMVFPALSTRLTRSPL